MKYAAAVALVVLCLVSSAITASQAPKEVRNQPSQGPVTQAPQGPVTQAPQGPVTQAPEASTSSRRWTAIEVVLSVGVLVFMALALVLQAIVILKTRTPWQPNSILRMNGVILIVGAAVLLVVAGYSNDQMTPVIGLLGSIAGYLLGSGEAQPHALPSAAPVAA